ncbi:MAG: exodeoxyribonuclease III [Maricaulaceae bacterium]
MQIASWNVNSVKARMHAVTAWLKSASPDVACLQEIKTVDEAFPFMEIEALGYNVEVHGQKSYNGVAILSKRPFEEVTRQLAPLNAGDEPDEQARYIEAVIAGDNGPVRVASIYLPNGNPTQLDGEIHPKYKYKLAWMERLARRARTLLTYEEPLVLAGDYNVIPADKDVHNPDGWRGDAAFRPETHAAFQRILNLGLTEAFEQMDGRAGQYTFWDYQRGAWQNNHGIRIDHLLLSPQAADKITELRIDKIVRDGEKPSDHVPIVGTFNL